MKKMSLLLLSFSMIAITTQAQQRYQYRNYTYGGVVSGESKSALQLQTIHGVQYKSWFAGLGVGVDNYIHRTLPLFASGLKYLTKEKNFFVNTNLGTHFSWGKEEGIRPLNGLGYKFNPGFFGEAGIGFIIPFNAKGQGMVINGGYSFKSFKERHEVPVFCINAPCPTDYEYIKSRFNRWGLRMGFMF